MNFAATGGEFGDHNAQRRGERLRVHQQNKWVVYLVIV